MRKGEQATFNILSDFIIEVGDSTFKLKYPKI